MMQKQRPIRIKKIRESARGQDCTIQSPWCNCNPETVVFAHYHRPGHGTMGGKSDDTSGAYACSACHDWLDGRVIHKTDPTSSFDPRLLSKESFWFGGCLETWRLLIENGVLK